MLRILNPYLYFYPWLTFENDITNNIIRFNPLPNKKGTETFISSGSFP